MYLTPKMYLKHTYKFGLVIFAFSFKAEWNSIYSLSYIWMIPVKLIRKLQRRENFLRLQLESPSPYYPRISTSSPSASWRSHRASPWGKISWHSLICMHWRSFGRYFRTKACTLWCKGRLVCRRSGGGAGAERLQSIYKETSDELWSSGKG